MNLEGEIGADVAWDGGAVARVDLRSTRPDVAATVLEGRGAAEAIALVGRLFPLCGRAQGVVAALACEAARGEQARPVDLASRARIVDAEHASELLWHELLDAPLLLGEPGLARELGAARRALDLAIARGGDALAHGAGTRGWPDEVVETAARHVFGAPPAQWLRRWSDAPDEWARAASTPAARVLATAEASAEALGSVAPRFLPALDEGVATRSLAPAMDADPHFARAPCWEGLPAETGPTVALARHGWVAARLREGRLVAARLGARLIALAELLGAAPRAAPFGSAQVRRNDGIAWGDTARGTLVHRVGLAGGRVERWRIVAPTDWNFHPQGALAQGLRALRPASAARLERLCALVVHSLDPCVACSVKVTRVRPADA